MNNSYLIETGEPIGYCSVIPKQGEEHMFGERLVEFVYEIDKDFLFFMHKPAFNKQIENNYRYHAPKEGQPEKYEAIRSRAKQLAYLIEELAPNSREKSLALTNLEQSVFWVNAGIARNE